MSIAAPRRKSIATRLELDHRYALPLVVLLASLLASETNCQQQASTVASELVQQDAINLQSILQHQQALAVECQRFKEAKERELEYLLNYNAQEDQVQLPQPMPMKVPAVCMLFLAAELDEALDGPSPKLEFVNWIFNEEEIRRRGLAQAATTNSSAKMTKRASDPNSALLSDYLLDPSIVSVASNELSPEDALAAKFHQDIDTLMADKRYKEGIAQSRTKLASHLSPVVLIPGLLGSRLQAKIDKTKRVNVFCSKQSDWQDIWMSIRMFLPIAIDCWLDNARMDFDPSTGFTKQPAGVEARVPDFGSVESVRHLDLRQPSLTGYYQPIIERYEQLGYTPDVNLLAAPYDFRLAPQQLAGYFQDLKSLIEEAQYNSPSGKKVTLVCHSMGCTHALVFLRQQSAAWRQKRIRKLIALSSPWGGTIKALKALVVGDQMDMPLVSEPKIRKLVRTFPSIAYLMPQAEIFSQPNPNQIDGGGPVLVQTPQRSYKIADLEALMRDLNLTIQYTWFQKTAALIKPLEPLADLSVDCIYSRNYPTAETMIFRSQTDFPDGPYELVKGEGDGTVNLQSLSICDLWSQRLPDKVRQTVILNTNHLGVISHKSTLTHITDDVMMN